MFDRYCLGVTGGVVVAQVATLQEFFGTDANWHIALSAYVLLVLLCYIPYPWFPESPTYLYIVAGKKERAKRGKLFYIWMYSSSSLLDALDTSI